MQPDERYRCGACGRVLVDDQLAYEEHLIAEHDQLRDMLDRLTRHVDSE